MEGLGEGEGLAPHDPHQKQVLGLSFSPTSDQRQDKGRDRDPHTKATHTQNEKHTHLSHPHCTPPPTAVRLSAPNPPRPAS